MNNKRHYQKINNTDLLEKIDGLDIYANELKNLSPEKREQAETVMTEIYMSLFWEYCFRFTDIVQENIDAYEKTTKPVKQNRVRKTPKHSGKKQ